MNTKVWYNGKIYTVNPKQPWAEAIVTAGDEIKFVGSSKEALQFSGEQIDLENKLVLPGFIDSHVHFMIGGLSLTKLDLGDAASKDDFRSKIIQHVKENTAGWIEGGNWNHLQFDKKVLPTKEWVDDLTGDRPLYLTRVDIHTALVNSAALKIAGITKDTPDPDGGEILRDEQTGEPTGILKDTAMNLVSSHIPAPTDSDYNDAMNAAQNEALKNGITSVHDITEEKYYHIYQKFADEGKLRTRLNCIHPINEIEELLENNRLNKTRNKFFRSNALKAFADGSLGSNTAWFFEPYADDPNTKGLPTAYMTNGNFKKWALLADKSNVQLAVHAIGDRSVSEVLDVFEEIVTANPERDRRFRIEHVQHIKEKDIERMKKLNVIASMQPSQLYDDGVWAEEKVGKERLKGTHAVKTLLDSGIKVCLGSDWTVTPLDVIHGIDIAVNRKIKDGSNPNGWIPSEKISVKEAVKAYTIDAAYASFEEKYKGSIEMGKLADFIVLDKNIFEISASDIKDLKVERTLLGGEQQYQV